MPLEFICQYCHSPIQVKYLKKGESAQCKNCGKNNTIPENAQEIAEIRPIQRPISSIEFSATPDYAYYPDQEDQSKYEQPHIPITNSYIQILTEPRATFQYILSENKFTEALLLVFANMLISIMNNFIFAPFPTLPLISEHGVAGVILITLAGVIFFFFAIALNWLCCRIMGGTGSLEKTFIVIGWSELPSLALILMTPCIIIYKYALKDPSLTEPTLGYTLFGMLFAVPIGIYSLVLLIIGLSEAHRITVGRVIIGFIWVMITLFLALLVLILGCAALFSHAK